MHLSDEIFSLEDTIDRCDSLWAETVSHCHEVDSQNFGEDELSPMKAVIMRASKAGLGMEEYLEKRLDAFVSQNDIKFTEMAEPFMMRLSNRDRDALADISGRDVFQDSDYIAPNAMTH